MVGEELTIESMPAKSKVYEEVLNEIRKYISLNELAPGDKLPSERELAERLQAGRSSVREALRAIELLGLIETRRGEGTFLRSYRSYHTVELLSTFILHDPNVKNDIFLSKKILEKEAAKLSFRYFQVHGGQELASVYQDPLLEEKQKHYQFFEVIFQHAENDLLQKIWQLMEDFSFTLNQMSYNPHFYKELTEVLISGKYETIEKLFKKLYL